MVGKADSNICIKGKVLLILGSTDAYSDCTSGVLAVSISINAPWYLFFPLSSIFMSLQQKHRVLFSSLFFLHLYVNWRLKIDGFRNVPVLKREERFRK